MKIELTRTLHTTEATLGQIELGGWTFYTIELPWRSNEKGKSCVPAGEYKLVPYNSPRHGATYCLHNPRLNVYGPGVIPAGGRSYCEIHPANWASELNGCIALGMQNRPMYNPETKRTEPAVEESRIAVAKFLGIIGTYQPDHTLLIGDE